METPLPTIPQPTTPLSLDVVLGHPAVVSGEEPHEPAYALVRLNASDGAVAQPRLDMWFVLDASASMHRFVLDPDQRAYWQQRAEQRGEVSRQRADGRTGLVWTGQTLRELQQHVSTPMISTLRGVWRTLESLQLSDHIGVLAFADQTGLIYRDGGVADRTQRLDAAKNALARLGSGVDESGLGRGTRLLGALQQALSQIEHHPEEPVLRRMVLVSDGIIEDREACRPLLDTAMDRGLVISVIGVGDDFDEEFLMMAADLTRGNYYYAATAREVEQAVAAELEVIRSTAARQAHLRVVPTRGVVLRDVYPVSPQLSEFQALWTDGDGWRFRIGDVSAAQQTAFLVELAPPAHSGGELHLGVVRVEGYAPAMSEPFSVEAPIRLLYADDRMFLQARDDQVLDLVKRLEVYQLERRSSEAQARGDVESATKQLRAATRMLRNMGADTLADEMDAAATDVESGTRNLGRTKRVKAGTRRLTDRQPRPEG